MSSPPPDATEPAAIRLVREALEELLPPNEAAKTVAEALAAWGPSPPTEPKEWLELIQGPLREAARKRLDDTATYRLLWVVEETMLNTEQPTGRPPKLPEAGDSWGSEGLSLDLQVDFEDAGEVIEETSEPPTAESAATGSEAPKRRTRDVITARPPPMPEVGTEEENTGERDGSVFWPDDRTTMSLPILPDGPATMIVLSSSDGFAKHLGETLGAEILETKTAFTLGSLNDALVQSPDFVLVDGAMPPDSVDRDALEARLRDLPREVWRAVWGSELDFGSKLSKRLVNRGISCIPLAAKDGVAPLLDLVRARRQARGAGRKPGA